MAVTVQYSTFFTETIRKRAFETFGKLRQVHFNVLALAAADATSTIDLCNLPPGPLRLLPALSHFNISALGAARTLDIGHRAYFARPPVNAQQAEDLAAIVANIDVSSALAGAVVNAAVTKLDLYSLSGITVCAQINDAAIPANATMSGYLTFIQD